MELNFIADECNFYMILPSIVVVLEALYFRYHKTIQQGGMTK